MATIEELEQKIDRLENELHEKDEQMNQLMEKSKKALDTAMNAYKVDHYGYIWAYDPDLGKHRKTKMRVMTPEISDGAIESQHIADKAIEGRHIGDGVLEGRMFDDKSIDGRSIAPNTIGSDKIVDGSIEGDRFEDDALIPGKLADDAVQERNIKDRNVTSQKIAIAAIIAEHLAKKCVGPDKVSDGFQAEVVLPLVSEVDNRFENITNEIYSMIASLQVGGIALSDQLGDREDIGISQKALTKIIGSIWEAIEDPSHHTFDFNLTAVPSVQYQEGAGTVTITADASGAISNFDSIKIYVNDVLTAQSSDVRTFVTSAEITENSTIKAEGVIMGKKITKETQVYKMVPFFMGSGQNYEDVMNVECQKQFEGTIEGDYDVIISNDGDYMFIIIPIAHKDEFRRADMNGYEIPTTSTVMTDYVVYQSQNTYQAGTYNVDIDINS